MKPVSVTIKLKNRQAGEKLLRRFLSLGWKSAPLGAQITWETVEAKFVGGMGEDPSEVTFRRVGQDYLPLREYAPLPRKAIKAVARVWEAYTALAGEPPEGIVTFAGKEKVVDVKFTTVEALEKNWK